jgi:hypothetical protein
MGRNRQNVALCSPNQSEEQAPLVNESSRFLYDEATPMSQVASKKKSTAGRALLSPLSIFHRSVCFFNLCLHCPLDNSPSLTP